MQGFLVTLDVDVSVERAKEIKALMRAVSNVRTVRALPVDCGDYMARDRAVLDLGSAIIDAIKEFHNGKTKS